MQPKLISDYNKYMGGVDRSDQNIGLYKTTVRGKKWYMPLFSHSVDMACTNAWQLHKQSGGKLDHLAFRRRVALNLLETYGKSNTPSNIRRQGSHHTDSRFDRLDHFIVEQSNRTRCGMCHKKSGTRCEKCDIGLHVRCFKQYHIPQ